MANLLRPVFRFRLQNPASLILYTTMFIMGGCGLAYEYTFSKLSSDLLGNSAQQWALVIGIMMLFMGLGADLQKRVANENLVSRFILIELLIAILGGLGPILLLWIFGEFRLQFFAVQYSLVALMGLLIGMELPLIARLNEQYVPELRANVGSLLRMDYLGAFAGALLWIFLLPIFFDLIASAFVLGILNMLAALLGLIYFRKLIRQFTLYVALSVLTIGLLLLGILISPASTVYSEQFLYRDKIIHSETTRYQHIVLTQNPHDMTQLYINNTLQFSSFDEHIYHEFLVHPAMSLAEQRKNVLVLGGGDGLALREILKYPDVDRVTLVDLDARMIELASEHPVLRELNANAFADARVTAEAFESPGVADQIVFVREALTPVHEPETHALAEVWVKTIDADQFLRQTRDVYDVVIVDLPDPTHLELSKLYSLSFYKHLRDHVARRGVMVQQATSPTFGRELFLMIGRTMQAAGFHSVPYHHNVPTFGQWSWWISQRDDAMSAEGWKARTQEPLSLAVDTRHLTAEVFQASLSFPKGWLVARDQRINTILNNAVYDVFQDMLRRGFKF